MTGKNLQTENKISPVTADYQVEAYSETPAKGPHIPLIQWEQVWGPITNITVTLIVFACMVIFTSIYAKKSLKKWTWKFRIFLLNFLQFFDTYLRDTFGDKKQARKYFPLIVGMFIIIFFGNIFGLIIDWFGLSVSEKILYYLRPMHSDLNTTLVLAAVVVTMMVVIQVKSQWWLSTAKSYVFNFHGQNFIDKCVNVFVGWLHFIGLGSTLASLSLRLFGNIFAWIVLISVITFLWAFASAQVFEVGRLLATPFWFFEVFVALIQAIVFTALMMVYFKQSSEHH